MLFRKGLRRLKRCGAALLVLVGLLLGLPHANAQQLYFIHADHLDTPRVITNDSGQVVWQWDYLDPFGNNPPIENPSGLGNFTFNPRFPGQYYDKETNLHYNYFRDYDPGIGRYTQSDPIGLAGGLNTYGYAGADPIRKADPLGLDYGVMIPWMNNVARNPPTRNVQRSDDYWRCIENATAAGGFAGICVGIMAGRGSIPVTTFSAMAGALGGQLIGQAFVCRD
jgi:RHS repeat-associated protein